MVQIGGKHYGAEQLLTKTLTHGTEGKGKVEAMGKIFENLGNSIAAKFHRIITLFETGKWVNNNSVMKTLQNDCKDLTSKLASANPDDKTLVKQGVAEMKAVIKILRDTGANPETLNEVSKAVDDLEHGFYGKEVDTSSITKGLKPAQERVLRTERLVPKERPVQMGPKVEEKGTRGAAAKAAAPKTAAETKGSALVSSLKSLENASRKSGLEIAERPKLGKSLSESDKIKLADSYLASVENALVDAGFATRIEDVLDFTLKEGSTEFLCPEPLVKAYGEAVVEITKRDEEVNGKQEGVEKKAEPFSYKKAALVALALVAGGAATYGASRFVAASGSAPM